MSEIWKAIKEFLLSCHITEAKHVDSLMSLYVFLKDGEALMKVYKYIGRGLVDGPKEKLSPESRARLNLEEFLIGCKINLKLSETDLFQPEELYECKNLNTVFNTLSVISRVSANQSKTIKPFIFNRVCETLTLNSEKTDILFVDESQIDDMQDYSIYDNAVNSEAFYESAENFIELLDERYIISEEKLNNKYEHAVIEVLQKEKSYFDGPLMLMSIIYDYLASNRPFRSLDLMFSNFQNMKAAHTVIIQSFYKNHFNKGRCLSHTIIKHKNLFLEYVPYVSKLNASNKHADEIWKDSKSKNGILDAIRKYNSKCRIYDLKSILVVPMQHILRYKMHFETMIKHCSDNEKSEELKLGAEEISDVIGQVDDCVNDEEMLEKIRGFHNKLIIPKKLTKSILRFDQFGKLRMIKEMTIYIGSSKKPSQRSVILFDKVIMITKTQMSKYQLEDFMIIKNLEVANNFNTEHELQSISLFNKYDKTSSHYKISVIDREGPKTDFIETFNIVNDKNHIPSEITKGHNLELKNFGIDNQCNICQKLLRGLLVQGYSCCNTGCNISVHYECLKHLKECIKKSPIQAFNVHSVQLEHRNSGIFSTSRSLSSVNPNEEEFLAEKWYFGKIDREKISSLLMGNFNGCFIVRDTDKFASGVAISLLYDGKIRHLKVDYEKGYFLTHYRKFPTLPELINYYQLHSLVEAYEKYDTPLWVSPVDYDDRIKALSSPIVKDESFIEFKAGDELEVISNFDPHIWVLKLDSKCGYAYSCFF